jgi:hypothetical protein
MNELAPSHGPPVSIISDTQHGRFFREDMRMAPVVSVITPTFEHAPYIRECLDSVVAARADLPSERAIVAAWSDVLAPRWLRTCYAAPTRGLYSLARYWRSDLAHDQ